MIRVRAWSSESVRELVADRKRVAREGLVVRGYDVVRLVAVRVHLVVVVGPSDGVVDSDDDRHRAGRKPL